MDKIELKPCPFCGSEARLVYLVGRDELKVKASCSGCNANKSDYIRTGAYFQESITKLIDKVVCAWNTRRYGANGKD